jgi:hypothetical protein
MKKMIPLALLCLWWASAAWGQSSGSPRLTAYEQQRYGDRLWEIPREPYQSRYQTEQYTSRLSETPAVPSGPRNRGNRSLLTLAPGPDPAAGRVQRRLQTRMQWENEQRRISDRSRQGFRQTSGRPRP